MDTFVRRAGRGRGFPRGPGQSGSPGPAPRLSFLTHERGHYSAPSGDVMSNGSSVSRVGPAALDVRWKMALLALGPEEDRSHMAGRMARIAWAERGGYVIALAGLVA